ncbi:MAG: hypothetical protein AAGD96_28790 [Chloroflexota bacterium]
MSKRRKSLWNLRPIIFILVTAILLVSGGYLSASEPAETRDPVQWPFVWNSIWNMPLGSNANYVPANISSPTGHGFTVDEDIIIMRPNAPQVDIVAHDAAWDDGVTRCGSIVSPQTTIIANAPIPFNFSTDPGYQGIKPNHSAAILMSDGETIEQTQPFHRCGAGGPAVSQFHPPSDNIKTGDGIRGAHGGSGMSSLGGTIRMGEMVRGGEIRHALKLNLFAAKNLSYNATDSTPGYRWPAIRADGYAGNQNSNCRYQGSVSALEMGALLALKPDFNINALTTEPAKIIAEAFMNYGGYVVDDTCWDVYALETEWGPDGRVIDQFEFEFGFPMESKLKVTCTSTNLECFWVKDMHTIFTSLHVVNNNSDSNIGGPGERRVACAPPFEDGTGSYPAGSVCDGAGAVNLSQFAFLPFVK